METGYYVLRPPFLPRPLADAGLGVGGPMEQDRAPSPSLEPCCGRHTTPTPAQEGLLGSGSPGADASRQDTLEAGGRAPAQRPSHKPLASGSLPRQERGLGPLWYFPRKAGVSRAGLKTCLHLAPPTPTPTPPHLCPWRRKDMSVGLKHSYHPEPRQVLLLGSLFPLGSAD